MSKRPSTAKEYLQGLKPREKLITLERGMKMLIQRLPDEAVMEIFQASGIKTGTRLPEDDVLKRMKPEQIIKLLRIAVSRGAKKPRVVLDGAAPKGALHYDDLLYVDKFKIMSESLEITGLGAEATTAREKFRE